MKDLTNKQLIQEVAKRINRGTIQFERDMYDREIGLVCQNYEWMFPDAWGEIYQKLNEEVSHQKKLTKNGRK